MISDGGYFQREEGCVMTADDITSFLCDVRVHRKRNNMFSAAEGYLKALRSVCVCDCL